MEQGNAQHRNNVIWIGCEPEADIKNQYEQRGLILKVYKYEAITDDVLNISKAIIIPYNLDTHKLVRSLIDKDVLQYGITIFISISSNLFLEAQRQLNYLLKNYSDRIELVQIKPHELAQRIILYNAGPYLNTELQITINNEKDFIGILGNEIIEEVDFPKRRKDLIQLLKRAFWDCERLNLVLLSGSKNSLVFRADVFFQRLAGPNPLPYFVKFDRLIRIRRERENYISFVSEYIPFNHRPNLLPERYVEGTCNGLLVGNFVEHSEPLADIALRGTFTSSIYSLFYQVMRGWQAQAHCIPQIRYTKERDLTLEKSLVADKPGLDLFKKTKLHPDVEQAVINLGCKSNPSQLIDMIKALPPVMHMRGPIHGDLHVRNIHVRGTDAILIDFYRTGLGPLLWDPAELEVSMCFGDMFETEASTPFFDDWCHMVKQLYNKEWIHSPLNRPNIPSVWEGISNCIREIRFYGRGLEIEEGTYQQALAINLLLRSFSTPKQLLPNSWSVKRLAYAYFLAESLLFEYGG